MARARPDATGELAFLRALVELQLELASTLAPAEVARRICAGARGALGVDRAELRLREPDGSWRRIAVAPSPAVTSPGESPSLSLSLEREGELLGELVLRAPLEGGSCELRPRAERLAAAAALALGNALTHAAALERERDALTGLQRRGHLQEALAAELGRASRHGRELSLLLLDVDHLKRLNDAGGHGAGDRALRSVAHTLAARARASDLVVRYGGDEFAVMLPETDRSGACAFAEDVRATLGRASPVRTSVGIASYPQDAETSPELIEAADRALYRAKSGGRDRVC